MDAITTAPDRPPPVADPPNPAARPPDLAPRRSISRPAPVRAWFDAAAEAAIPDA